MSMTLSPYLARRSMTAADWTALQAQGFWYAIQPPPSRKISYNGPNHRLQAAFDEYMAMPNPPRGNRGILPALSRKHGCAHSSLLNKIYKHRLHEKRRKAA